MMDPLTLMFAGRDIAIQARQAAASMGKITANAPITPRLIESVEPQINQAE